MQAETFAQWAGFEHSHRAIELLRQWDIHPLAIDGVEVAAACMSGSEIHFAIDPMWRNKVIAKQRTRKFLAPLFERHGYLTTREVVGGKTRSFLERMGFSFTWSDGLNDHYMMTELPFSE